MKIKFAKYQKVLEAIGLLLVVGLIVFVFVRYSQLPDKIPGHYNAIGEIDRWGNKLEIFMVPIISTLLYAFITLITFIPDAWNVPVKITEENRERVYRAVRDLIIFTKIEMLGMFFFITYFSSYSKKLPVLFLPVSLVIIFGTMTFFIFYIIRVGKRTKNK